MSATLILSLLAGAIVAACSLFLCALSALGVLQQQNYTGGEFLSWLFRKNNALWKRWQLLALCSFLLVALANACFSFLPAAYANLISALPFVGLCALFYCVSKKHALKVQTKRTPRLIRLGVCFFLLLTGVIFGVGCAFAAIANAIARPFALLVRFVPIALFPLLLPFLLYLANGLMKAYELPRNAKFVRRAAEALAKSDCVKVGITGSCGKTSVKNMAYEMLSTKFKVIATPASYNTPAGIARTVNELGADCDIFLAEMGARRKGDIAELCDIVRPTVGVVTAILPQHLQTFGSLQAIAEEKGVLLSRTQKGVVGVSASSLAGKNTLVEGADFSVEALALTREGTSFTLRLPDGEIAVKTPLLGKHAAQDLALAAALCSLLGMTREEIALAIGQVKPVPHRLQLVEANGLHILDDSYNANVEGAKNAVDTLRLFEGKKFVVTPGIVELGELEEEENAKLGASLVGLDGVILVGETLVLSVRAGYLAAGGEEKKLTVVPTLERATELLKERLSAGDSVLFLNDLPDCYA